MSDALIMGRDEALGMCERVLAASTAEQTEVNLIAGRSGLTRFANNHIHQNVAEANVEVMVRAAVGSRVGVASTNDTSEAGLADVAARAALLASLSTPDERFPGLPEAGEEPPALRGSPATAAFGPAERAGAVRACIAVARERGQVASGACSASVAAHAVANSLGVRAWQESTRANLRMVFTGADSSGFAEVTTADARTIDAASLASVAADKCARSAAPTAVEPGRWDVILEPAASANLLSFLAMSAFNGLACAEGRSPLCGRMGERVCGENISLHDDGLDPRGLPVAFDSEGVPRRRVELLVEGVAANVVHDSRTAAMSGARSTGHASGPGSSSGPTPGNLFMGTGAASVAEMIAATERGLLVTRFHYANLVDPARAIFTAMTRDGTFLIEGGEIVGGVRNLRVTENMLEALDRVAMVGRDATLAQGVFAPPLLVRDFRFSGATEF